MSKTHVPLDRITDNPHQVRIDTGDLDNLAQSILAHGLRQMPEGRLVVDGEPPGSYTPYTHHEDEKWWLDKGEAQLASGHRRAAAVQLLNDDDTVTDAQLKGVGLVPGHVPVDLQRLSDEEMLDLGTAENLDREELSPIEEARLIQEHVDAGRSLNAIAPHFGGRSASWISNRKRLLKLPTYVQEHVHEGDLSVREGQALIKAFALEEEHAGAYEKLTRTELKPGNITTAAMRGEIDSDGIRARTEELEEVLSRIERATHDTPGADQGERARPEESSTSQNADQTDADQTHDDPKDNRESQNADAEEVSGARAEERPRPEPGSEGSSATDHEPVESAGRDAEDDPEAGAQQEGAADQRVSGDGAPSAQPGRETPENWPEIRSAAIRGLYNSLHGNGLARDIAFQLGPEWVHGKPKAFATWYVDNMKIPEGRDSDENVLDWIQAWAELRGFADRLPEPQWERDSPDVGHVDSGQVDTLLAPSEDMWDAGAAAGASVASLYVAYVVADKRMERWRREEIAKEMRDRQERVTEEDFPDDVWEDVQAEIERRLEPETA